MATKLHTVRREPPWPFTDATVVINCTKEDYDGFEHLDEFREWSKDQALELTAGDIITDVKLPPQDFQPPTVLSYGLHPTNGWYHGQLREKQGVFSSQYVQFQYSRVPLTLHNVTTAINNVEWEELCNCLCVPESKKDHIEQQGFEHQTRMLAEWWLLTDPAASWRRLICHLDYYGDPLTFGSDPSCAAAADFIRHNAEPVQDTSFTLRNVWSTLDCVQYWDDLGHHMDIAPSKRGRKEMMNYYITSMQSASWELLAGALYYLGEQTALTKVTSYFQRQPEPTLTIANLRTTLEKVELNHLGDILNVPRSRRGGTKETIIEEFIQNHPAPSWRHIADHLYTYYGNYHTVLQNIKQKYLKGKQLFNEAMKHGHVKSCNTAALFVGAAGSGKTCSKHVIMNEEPPEVRVSTPIAERPVKVMKIRTVEGLQWHRLSPADQKEILANIMALIAAEEGESSDQGTPTTEASAQATPARPSLKARLKALLRLRHGRSHSGWSLKRTKHASPSKLRVNVASHGSSSTLDADKAGDTSTLKQSSTSDTDKPVGVAAVETLLESSTTETELARMIELSPGAEQQLEVNLVHITDSGGQPQFHEILPVFLRRASIYIFVTKLSEGLDEQPLVMYFDSNGNLISKPTSATHTNMQIFRHCIRTLQSHRSQRGGKAPYIMIIGTHQDLEHLCSETREAKNHRLAEVLLPEFRDEVVYFKVENKEFIFPLNAKSPGKEEWEIAEEIRKIIMLKCAAEPDDIPLRWYCLELKLQEIAQALGRDVMSKEECFAVALRLHFDSESFEAALEYLDGLNIIFYYPDILPDVVFTDTQVLLDKVTELVKLSYELKAGGADSAIKARGGEYQKFQDLALVTPKFLKSFHRHYVPGLFTPLELVKLFRALLIFADFSDTEYFMPSLLQRISSKEVAEHRIGSSAAAAPLILYFSHGGPLLGMFCSLIVFLLSAGNCFPSPWKLLDHLGTPVCLYRNCVKFTIPHHPGTVTLIDAFSFFELHVSSPDNLCGFVHDAVLTGLKKAAANLSYNNSIPEVAFFCSCSTEEPHPATVSAAQNRWICTRNRQTYGNINEKQQMWLTASVGVTTSQSGSACSPPPAMYPSSKVETLSEKDLLDITEYLLDLDKTHIYNLGLLLGLRQTKVKALKDSDSFLDDVIAAWLRKEDQVTDKGEPSWTVLISALKHRRVGQTGIGDKIAKDHGFRE